MQNGSAAKQSKSTAIATQAKAIAKAKQVTPKANEEAQQRKSFP